MVHPRSLLRKPCRPLRNRRPPADAALDDARRPSSVRRRREKLAQHAGASQCKAPIQALGLFKATAALTSALKAPASICSPSWMSIARRVPPSRLELKRRDGSGTLAPRANVSFTTFLYVSPVQTIPWCDQTGTPAGFVGFFHFRSSTIW